MMRSLFSGVAGLKTHQTRMDVIGNNIANVNTTAFKASSMVFSELMSQTTQRASGPNAETGTGGVNARQIGLGVKAGAISINISGQGSAQSTGNPFDIMITGDNFFVVSNGMENFFTRDGSFYVDGAGNLAMTSNGYNVMGWGVDEETGNIKKDTVAALRIMSNANMTYPPEATSQATLSGIIDRYDTDVTSSNGKTVNLNFYDQLGYTYTARLTFKQSAADNQYSLEFTKLLDANGEEVEIDEATKQALLGNGIAKTQANEKAMKMVDNYAWDANGNLTANGTIIVWRTGTALSTTNPGEEVALYSTVDPTKTAPNPPVAGDTTVYYPTDPDEQLAENQKALELIAEAYGYGGSLNEFLNRQITVDPNDPASATPSVRDIIYGGSDGTNYGTLPTTLGTEAVSAGRTFYGCDVVFDRGSEHGNIQSVDGNVTNFTSTLHLSALGENFSDITVDLSTVVCCDNKGTSTVGADKGIDGLGTGRRLGDMIGVSISTSGMIYASYDNGMTRLLGQIASASFANASGLEKAGDNLYSATLNSGEFDGIGVDITASGGYMSSGQLEMSNVDLSSEFTTMITTQRGFQANSRIITVSDTMLEELTNLKR
ncbi:MAG: flagellar hook-basal body complex protein [Butyrivibrio sp.]|nr:flagellar hook-basal body complex protein [Muribaculum sp.]MCM1552020.1 flagellar hook-basal body complex protein [Butyrivibrio sp.]